jgi:hypothetical protein
MRARAIGTLSIMPLAFGAAMVACFDLFHSTRDVLTACEIDAATPACRTAGTPDARVPEAGAADLCSWSTVDARRRAEHACAWLGACETPMGKNAFGSCMFRGLMAFDCAANPNHRVKGRSRDLWECLSLAHSCRDVDACVFADATQVLCQSAGNYTACAPSKNDEVRVECQDAGVMPYPKAHGENCALWGQVCAPDVGGGTCAGQGASDAGTDCPQGCYGSATRLHYCRDGRDLGLDCASNGAQRCDGFPLATDASWVACVAETDAGAAAWCPADHSATCSATGLATSCPSGVLERLDCAILLGSANACVPGPFAPEFDWTSPCTVSPPQCGGDSCDGGTVVGCERGAVFSTDCASQGLGACHMVTTDVGGQSRASCTTP